MEQALQKQQQPDEQIAIYRRLYLEAWETAFNEFMFLMAEQYNLELLMMVNGKQAPSPIVKFWRESLQSLTPNQLRMGLKRYMDLEHSGFKPTPGQIKANINEDDGKDKPIKRKDPECPECHGEGWRMVDVDSKIHPGEKVKHAADCFCVKIDYQGETYTPAPKQLLEAPDEEILAELKRKICEVADKPLNIKRFPEEPMGMSDAEYEARRRQLEEQKKVTRNLYGKSDENVETP